MKIKMFSSSAFQKVLYRSGLFVSSNFRCNANFNILFFLIFLYSIEQEVEKPSTVEKTEDEEKTVETPSDAKMETSSAST